MTQKKKRNDNICYPCKTGWQKRQSTYFQPEVGVSNLSLFYYLSVKPQKFQNIVSFVGHGFWTHKYKDVATNMSVKFNANMITYGHTRYFTHSNEFPVSFESLQEVCFHYFYALGLLNPIMLSPNFTTTVISDFQKSTEIPIAS